MRPVPNETLDTGLYPVIDVDGRLPEIPTDFIGASRITVVMAGGPCRLDGSGLLTDRGLEFRQRITDGDGNNVARWAIAEDGNERFWAEPLRHR